MRTLFEHNTASWVRYDDYEWKSAADGHSYLLPASGSDPMPYDPMTVAEDLVLDAMDIGQLLFTHQPEEIVKAAMRDFARKYGLLGIMTALPTTARFFEINSLVLPVNDYIREATMPVADYVNLFFPFQQPDFESNEDGNRFSSEDKHEVALFLTYDGYPQAQIMSFMRNYGERYEWQAKVFRDWAFTMATSFLYYEDRDKADEDTLHLYQKGMAAFDGNAPTYHIALLDRPTLVWDFHSLLLAIKMLLSIMLTDDEHPLRLCRQCQKAFISRSINTKFCSQDCKKKFNEEQKKRRT